MSNASHKTAEQGFYLYLEGLTDGLTFTRAEINALLAKVHHHQGISNRTYEHYQRLVRHGHRRYMPINELDVMVRQGKQMTSPNQGRLV